MTDPYASYRAAVDVALRRLLTEPEPSVAPLYGMMRYHLGWCDAAFVPTEGRTGKRLRPLIALLCCEALGGDWQRALPYAAAIELVHGFSLIHDDIEDNGDTRHERLTVWRVWGLAQGINTGDMMWTLARASLLELSALKHSPEVVLAAVALLDRACLQLCQGQFLDISFESEPFVDVAAYEEMARGKTAALLAAACEGGALLAGASAAQQAALAAFGQELGLAYQIIDDLLGLWGDAALTGKSAESDLAARKKSYPVAYALQWHAARGSDELERAYALRSADDTDILALALIEQADARDYARAQAQAHHAAMLRHLDDAQLTGVAAELLTHLVAGLLARKY